MGVTVLSHIKEKRSLKLFQIGGPRKIAAVFLPLNIKLQLLRTESMHFLRYFVPAGKNCIVMNFMVCTTHQILAPIPWKRPVSASKYNTITTNNLIY
jgi:hypothetical protein